LSSDTNRTFIDAVYEFRYLLIYLHYKSIKRKKLMKGRKWHVKWLAGRARSTFLLQRNLSTGEIWTKCISVSGVYVEKWRNTM